MRRYRPEEILEEWGFSLRKETARRQKVEAARRAMRRSIVLAPRPPKTAPIPVRQTLAPSKARELTFDGRRYDYRVFRGGQWISLPVVSIQHVGRA